MTDRKETRLRSVLGWALAGAFPVMMAAIWPSSAGAVDPKVIAAEKKRVEVIEKVKPAVVAVILMGGRNGGSGVLISEDGYALTNFHVTSGAGGPVMKCGLP